MSRGKKFRPNRSEYDRVIDQFGLNGFSNKDMSLYPKLDVCPLPFPYSDVNVTQKRDQLNDIAADLENKFRNSPGNCHKNFFEVCIFFPFQLS